MSITLENRVLGSLYGMATGDALGVPSSTYPQKQVEDTWGGSTPFIRPLLGHIFHDGLKSGEYTDDTEQALALMHSFIRNKKVVPHDVVNEIIKWADRVKGKYASPLGPTPNGVKGHPGRRRYPYIGLKRQYKRFRHENQPGGHHPRNQEVQL